LQYLRQLFIPCPLLHGGHIGSYKYPRC
jgi:hypothetical protein